jgi:polar amino acid transport system ATP-binding protein
MTTVLRLENIHKSFGDTTVLQGISLEVAHGEVVALIGASGSGKSTLLRCINLLEQIDDGQIWLSGDDISDPRVNPDAIRARIGVVFQQFNLFPHLSVEKNITLSLTHVFGMSQLTLLPGPASSWSVWAWQKKHAGIPIGFREANNSAWLWLEQ